MSDIRIYTRCPACGNDTLTINDDRHLLCTWHRCPDPGAIEKTADLRATVATLTRERNEAIATQGDIQIELQHAKDRSQMWHDRRKAAEIERDSLLAQNAELAAQKKQLRAMLSDVLLGQPCECDERPEKPIKCRICLGHAVLGHTI